MDLKNTYFHRMSRNELAFYWFGLSIFSLTISGLYAFFIGVARMPGLSSLFTDPGFFRRSLVVHVDLGVSVWFTAFPVVLFHLLNRDKRPPLFAPIALSLSTAGVFLMMLSGFAPSGEPHLSNYIPIISHPLFVLGLILYFVGVAFNYFSSALFVSSHQEEISSQSSPLNLSLQTTQFGVRIGALYYLTSLATLLVSWWIGDARLSGASYYEMLMWGGGHVLQFSNVAFMLVCWNLLASDWLGESPINRKQSFFIFGWLGLPILFIPFIASQDIFTSAHRDGFTQMMRWGIFPPVVLYLVFVISKIKRGILKNGFWDIRPWTLVLSPFLIITGFLFGAAVRGPDLRLPGHYHASIGAVTMAYMSAAYVLAQTTRHRWASWQAILTGLGQWLFSLGMFIAGSYGMARKVYGVEQKILHPAQTLGMRIMGLGGALALIGGVVFIVIMLKKLLPKLKSRTELSLGT